MFCEKAALTGANMVILLVEELKVLASPLSCKHPKLVNPSYSPNVFLKALHKL